MTIQETEWSDEAATFGDRLAQAREWQQLSQEQLARKLGLKVATVRNWETDRSEPRANKLQTLAGFLNVSMVWLMTGQGESPKRTADQEIPGNLHQCLAELRDLRSVFLRSSERLGRLEKRLRTLGHEG